MVSDVSHELRSPLSRLQVALGLVRQRAGAHPTPEPDRIERETERLNELIGQLLSLARLETRPGWLSIQVSDHGPGVPEDMLARLFEPFVRVGNARGRFSGGLWIFPPVSQACAAGSTWWTQHNKSYCVIK